MDKQYETILKETFSEIKKADAELAKHATEYTTTIGCSPEVMQQIDSMYHAANEAHQARIAELDKTFGDVRGRRTAFLDRLNARAQGMADEAAKLEATSLSLRALPLVDPAVAAGIDAKAQGIRVAEKSLRNAIASWCKPVEPVEAAEPQPTDSAEGASGFPGSYATDIAIITQLPKFEAPFRPGA